MTDFWAPVVRSGGGIRRVALVGSGCFRFPSTAEAGTRLLHPAVIREMRAWLVQKIGAPTAGCGRCAAAVRGGCARLGCRSGALPPMKSSRCAVCAGVVMEAADARRRMRAQWPLTAKCGRRMR